MSSTLTIDELGSEHSQAPMLWPGGPRSRLVCQNLLIVAGYWALAFLVKWYFSRYQMWPAPIWAPAGVALFAAMSMGRRCWSGIFLGSLLTNTITFGETPLWAAVVSAGNAFGPILAAELLLKRISANVLFSTVRNLLYFVLCTFLSGVVSATAGVTVNSIAHGMPGDIPWDKWFDWMFSDVGASLLFTPMFLLWQHKRPSVRETQRPHEFLMSTALTIVAVLYLLFGSTGVLAADAGASFLVLLPVLWMAVRLSLSLAYPMFLAVMASTITGTMAGYGPFAGVESGGALIIFAQMGIGFGASVLLLGAAANEQRAAENSLRKLNQELECRIELRTAALRSSQQRLEKAALYDSLTGLPNRRLLEERFGSLANVGQRATDRLCLLLIDLDCFKQINDNFGHDAGDAFLIESGCRLTTSVRETDTVSRMGGDEFAVLLSPSENQEGVEAVCHRILRAFSVSMSYNEHELSSSASIGVALFPDHGTNWHEIYKAADIALYDAKHSGRNAFRWSVPESQGMRQ